MVPDLEKGTVAIISSNWRKAETDPNAAQVLDYQWSVFQLIDQLVRDECGGEMFKAIREGNIILTFIQTRIGDELSDFIPNKLGKSTFANKTESGLPLFCLKVIKEKSSNVFYKDHRRIPGQRGEVHRWMYDRFSLSF